jgi:hypothetical protein
VLSVIFHFHDDFWSKEAENDLEKFVIASSWCICYFISALFRGGYSHGNPFIREWIVCGWKEVEMKNFLQKKTLNRLN